MLNIAIVDGDIDFCQILIQQINISFLSSNFEYKINVFHNAEQLLNKALITTYHLILMDVILPGMNGLDVAKKLWEYNLESSIVFITKYLQHMTNAFGLNIFGCIDKKDVQRKLPIILNKYIIDMEGKKLLKFKTNDGIYLIEINEICYASFESRKVALYTVHEKIMINLLTLNHFYEKVKNFSNFIYVNRSTIVNLKHVRNINADRTISFNALANTIPISKDKYAEVKHDLFTWLSSRDII